LPVKVDPVKLREFLPELVQVMEKDLDGYAFVSFEQVQSTVAAVDPLESIQVQSDSGVVLRIFKGGMNFESASNRLKADDLLEKARALRSLALSQAGNGYSYMPEVKEPPHADFYPPGHRIEELVGAEEILHRARELSDQVRAAADAYAREHSLDRLYIRSSVSQRLTRHIFVDRYRNWQQVLPLSMAYIVSSTPTGQSRRVYSGGQCSLDEVILTAGDLNELAVRPYELSRASRLEPGSYKILTGPDVTGVIAHEAFGHTQEADTCLSGRSIAPAYRERKERVGNEYATILNDPALYRHGTESIGTNASYFFDHEGQPSARTSLIEKGFLQNPMTDLLSAVRLGLPRTANGKRESWRRPTLTRQTNTYFAAGDLSFEEVLQKVDYGFLARHSHGGMEDPKGARLTAGTEYLEEIKDGALTGRIFVGPQGGHVELSGFVPDLLASIVAASSAPADGVAPLNLSGGCGKYHKEAVAAGCGGPFILWSSMNAG